MHQNRRENKMPKPKIEIRVGSDSDFPRIEKAFDCLETLGLDYTIRILSAHRTPHPMFAAAQSLEHDGFRVSIAAAGGAAHLPGMTASETLVPVVGLPVMTSNLGGWDSLYSVIQMPNGIPVGCVAPGQAESAALLAAHISNIDNLEARNTLRAIRGFETLDELANNWAPNVAIVRATSADLPQKEYDAAFKLVSELGMTPEEYVVPAVGELSPTTSIAPKLERDGMKVAIVCGYEHPEDGTPYLPAFISENTDIPVIGVPFVSGRLERTDESTDDIFMQMLLKVHPDDDHSAIGAPVAGMGTNKIINAVLYAGQILGLCHADVHDNVRKYRENLSEEVLDKNRRLQEVGVRQYMKKMPK